MIHKCSVDNSDFVVVSTTVHPSILPARDYARSWSEEAEYFQSFYETFPSHLGHMWPMQNILFWELLKM